MKQRTTLTISIALSLVYCDLFWQKGKYTCIIEKAVIPSNEHCKHIKPTLRQAFIVLNKYFE